MRERDRVEADALARWFARRRCACWKRWRWIMAVVAILDFSTAFVLVYNALEYFLPAWQLPSMRWTWDYQNIWEHLPVALLPLVALALADYALSLCQLPDELAVALPRTEFKSRAAREIRNRARTAYCLLYLLPAYCAFTALLINTAASSVPLNTRIVLLLPLPALLLVLLMAELHLYFSLHRPLRWPGLQALAVLGSALVCALLGWLLSAVELGSLGQAWNNTGSFNYASVFGLATLGLVGINWQANHKH